ncbi:endonuclease/exonuclease/phosphatase family protein [Lacibacter sp. H375]|uniref:endonuclease/exonuclease/phosphatase family protein n=1 Tax=Lacibacter sp. H375 TaxID=3133424 RepID=UPI0030BB7BC9
MKKFIFFIFTILISVQLLNAQTPLRVMTFNIRLNTSSDSLNAWPYRKDKVSSQILFHKIELLGVQEALHDQMIDLQQRLPQFKYTGGGRDDGKTKGEYSAIFYDTTKMQLLSASMFWLSETPTVTGSKGWDAAITRIVTWAKFKDRRTKKIFFAFNTHFDHMGKIARRESAKLVLQKVKEIAGSTPAVITGDFNAEPGDEPIQVIVDKRNPLHLTDAKQLSQAPHYGPTGTFTGFQTKERNDQPIDYIFLKGSWKVLTHAAISQTWGGRFASDHFSVIAELQFK